MVNLVSGRLTGYLKTPLLTEFEVLLGCESQFMQFPVCTTPVAPLHRLHRLHQIHRLHPVTPLHRLHRYTGYTDTGYTVSGYQRIRDCPDFSPTVGPFLSHQPAFFHAPFVSSRWSLRAVALSYWKVLVLWCGLWL